MFVKSQSMKKIFIVCMVVSASFPAAAHNFHQSSGEITVRDKTVLWDITANDLDVQRFFRRMSVTPEGIKSRVSQRIVVENNGNRCPLSEANMSPSSSETGHQQIALQFNCATPISKLALYYNLFFGERDHMHTATARMGSIFQTVAFTGMKTSATITLP